MSMAASTIIASTAGGMNINVSIPPGAACSVSVTTPRAANGIAVEPIPSACVTLQVDAMPSAVSMTPSTPAPPTPRSSCMLPAMPAMPMSASRTPISSPTIAPRQLSSPVITPRAPMPPSLAKQTAPASSSKLSCSSARYHHSGSSVLGSPVSPLVEKAGISMSSKKVMSRTLSSPTVVPGISNSSSVASMSKMLTSSAQHHIPVSTIQRSLTARTHSPQAQPKPLHYSTSNMMPYLGLGSLQHQANALVQPLSVRSSTASTVSAAPTVSSISSPSSSSLYSPAEDLELPDSGVDVPRRKRFSKSWSASTAASSDEAGDNANFDWPIFSMPARLECPVLSRTSFPELLDDHGISVTAAKHSTTASVEGQPQRAIQEADEARRRLMVALELMEGVKPKGRAVREEMQQAIDEAANVDLFATTLADLMKVRHRLKTAVASARSLYFAGIGRQAHNQPDDASPAVHALREAIEVANCACTLLLEETSDLLDEQEDVDVERLQGGSAPLLHVSRLQEIRGLLAKVLTVAHDFRLAFDEVQEAEKHRRKIHNVIQDLKGQVRVYCRLHNRTAEETIEGQCSNVNIINETTLEVPSNGIYEFDRIFAPGTQEEVFEECRDLVQSAIDGRNITIFAYGQTGSGKTYTMYGASGDEGIAPRAVSELFESIERLRCSHDVTVTASMVELYQSKLYDMLCGRPHRGTQLRMRDDRNGAIWIEGLEEVIARSASELQEILRRGVAKRATASHAMNRESSRSHLIFTIKIASVCRRTGETINGKLLLCDLAGSERIKKTEVEGQRQKEAIDINTSLTALGNVIMAVASKKRQIPYRNHRLTQLLRDSIGGTAKTLMFVNSSTSPSDLNQTISSLAYATRATRVYNQGVSLSARGIEPQRSVTFEDVVSRNTESISVPYAFAA